MAGNTLHGEKRERAQNTENNTRLVSSRWPGNSVFPYTAGLTYSARAIGFGNKIGLI